MPTLQETTEHLLDGREVQEGCGARPVPTVPQKSIRLRLAGSKRALKGRVVRVLLWVAALGPTAVVVADRVAHFFGVCLGH
jgi:hypothetical protein